MISGGKQRGYTIVEVLIVLAVTSALIVAVMQTFGGQSGKAEFAQVIREFELQLQDTSNDVATGYYPKVTRLSCSVDGTGALVFRATASDLGTNAPCTYIGKVILFAPDSNTSGYRVYSLAGRRIVNAGGAAPKNITEANPKVIPFRASPSGVDDYSKLTNLGPVMRIGSIKHKVNDTDPSPTDTFAIAFVSTFQEDGSSDPQFGASTTDLRFFNGVSSAGTDALSFSTDIPNHFQGASSFTVPTRVTSGQIEICIVSQASNQKGIITLYGRSKQLRTNSRIESGTTC